MIIAPHLFLTEIFAGHLLSRREIASKKSRAFKTGFGKVAEKSIHILQVLSTYDTTRVTVTRACTNKGSKTQLYFASS